MGGGGSAGRQFLAVPALRGRRRRDPDRLAAIGEIRSRLFIRETEWEAAQTVCLWRDGSACMRWRSRAGPAEKRERAGLLLLALASLLLRGGERVADDRARRAGRSAAARGSTGSPRG